jgi:hypothetical protein
MHCDFLGSDRLQETHMDALKLFNSKKVKLTMRGGFFTKFATLAHGVAPQVRNLKKKCKNHDISTIIPPLGMTWVSKEAV